VKDFLIDLKVPREKRDGLALVGHGNEILWVVGLRMSQSFRVTPATKCFLKLSVY
jgi:tRNA(Ile)-lysidine synthase